MVCSRKRHAAACVAVLGVALLLVFPANAQAAASLEERPRESVGVLQVTACAFGIEAGAAVDSGDALRISRFCPMELTCVTDPSSIEAGIDCGMTDMCGIEPCLCGSADAWGGCSCNGLETLEPTVGYASSDEGVVRVRQAFGKTWLIPVGSGSAVLSCSTSLKYFDGTTQDVVVEVGGAAPADAILGAIALLICAAVVALARVAMRGLGKRRAAKHRAGGLDEHGK